MSETIWNPVVWVTMIKVKEFVFLSALLHVARSQQTMAMTWTKYKRIHVQETSWQSMEIGDSELSGDG